MDYTVQEINAETNEVRFRTMTDEEIAQCQAEAARVEQAKLQEQADKAEASTKKQAVLNRLGITADEARLLLS